MRWLTHMNIVQSLCIYAGDMQEGRGPAAVAGERGHLEWV